MSHPRLVLFALALLTPAACLGGGALSSSEAATAGSFEVESTNISDGDVWALNRPIVITFNHPVDPASLGFGSIIIRPTDAAVLGNPVTGSFEFQSGSGDRSVIFRPTCPTDTNFSNGAFVPGGFNYELDLPTETGFGSAVLRDMGGHALSIGLTRTFRTPTPPSEALFIDTAVGPVVLDSVDFPSGLNLYTDPDSVLALSFNQAVDGSPANLNTTNIHLLYADDEVGGAGANSFTSTNIVPGTLLLADNCTATGSVVLLQIAGILPPNRNLRLEVISSFADISGSTNTFDQTDLMTTPGLAAYYGDGIIVDGDETADEFQDFFADSSLIDSSAAIEFPAADFDYGQVTASFAFPGQGVDTLDDLFVSSFQSIVVTTDGTYSFTDSNGRPFTMVEGVLEVDDLFIDDNAVLKGIGSNPLVLYVNGTTTINGRLDVSGDNATTPPAITKPSIPEIGASGQCGGGSGGGASQLTDQETLRAEAGLGAFDLSTGGGGGGEGAFLWDSGGLVTFQVEDFISAGGAGGTFALGTNASVTWDRWSGAQVPSLYDNSGPDLRSDTHTVFVDSAEIDLWFLGGEDGLRGSSIGGTQNEPVPSPPALGTFPSFGAYGMEDMSRDLDSGTPPMPNDRNNLDPAWNSNPPSAGGQPTFHFGHPTQGPDPGLTNNSVLANTLTIQDDFWGIRYNPTGEVQTLGELAAPWAGVGGGGSGDCQMVDRLDLDADSFLDPLGDFFPDALFPNGSTLNYWKGAAGGGGGGQLQIMAIGHILLGPNAQILANGGMGNSGESFFLPTQQVSGSGGGSGGHIVLHSASGLNLAGIDVGEDPVSLADIRPEIGQALGGRRGWAKSSQQMHSNGDNDGNSDFMVGRGGAGSNGIIQIHVPEPLVDILFDDSGDGEIAAHLDPLGNGVLDLDNLEEVLDLFFEPRPVVLLPVFSPKSQFQSAWIDTGLAGLHLSDTDYPDFAHALLSFQGTDTTTGLVLQDAGSDLVIPGASIGAGANTGPGRAQITSFGATIFQASVAQNSGGAGISQDLLRNPELLLGYDLVPDDSLVNAFEVVGASYNLSTDTLSLTTSSVDGPMIQANIAWSLQEKFLRLQTQGKKDSLPDDTSLKFEMQGADESAPGANTPGTPTAWLTDPASLEGLRYVRYRLTFDMDANGAGFDQDSPRPALQYVKFPFVW